jgi:hypothetical protein
MKVRVKRIEKQKTKKKTTIIFFTTFNNNYAIIILIAAVTFIVNIDVAAALVPLSAYSEGEDLHPQIATSMQYVNNRCK